MTGSLSSYYKATCPDGTSFYDHKTEWKPGRITRHPDLSRGAGALHATNSPVNSLCIGNWPCRLFQVEPRAKIITEGCTTTCAAWKVVAELPGWQALGPNGRQVAAFIEILDTDAGYRASYNATYYGTDAEHENDASNFAFIKGRGVAYRAAAETVSCRFAGHNLVEGLWNARAAASVFVVRDLISPTRFDVLTRPYRQLVKLVDLTTRGSDGYEST